MSFWVLVPALLCFFYFLCWYTPSHYKKKNKKREKTKKTPNKRKKKPPPTSPKYEPPPASVGPPRPQYVAYPDNVEIARQNARQKQEIRKRKRIQELLS